MATSRNDPRVVAAVNGAMKAMYSKAGTVDPDGRFVWSVVYPQFMGQAWCGAFMVWAYRQVGVDLMKCAWWYYIPYVRNFARNKGFWRSESGYGWQPCFDWHGDGVADHIGSSNPDQASDYFRSIEGNTSSGNAGSQSNGGGVWERYRAWDDIMGWVDMHAVLAWMIDTGLWQPGATLPNSSGTVSSGSPVVTVDGYWGPATTRALQRINGTPIDGIVSSQDAYWRSQNPGLQAGFEWVNNPEGSQLVARLQRAWGVTPDGLLGPATIKAMQRYYGTIQDGVLDEQSSCVMAMQRAINTQLGGK